MSNTRITTRSAIAFAVAGLFVVQIPTFAQNAARQNRFAAAHVRFEQNATDGDVEVVFEITGRDDGLAKLQVFAPDGRKVIEFAAPNSQDGNQTPNAGIRQFTFESPEPKDVAGLKAAYPAGEYKFMGTTTAGTMLESKATLSHELPATAKFKFPQPDDDKVPAKNIVIQWAAVPKVAGYKLELTNEESGDSIEANLPATTTSFAVPSGFLAPHSSYQLGIGTVSSAGNVSFVEMVFSTSAQ